LNPRFDLGSLPAVRRPGRVLMTTPDYFRVEYVINPHMEGHIGTVDPQRARVQWDALRETYERLDFTVSTVPGAEGLPDMVFCANQTLPYLTPGGTKGAVLSRMFAPQRRDEVPHFARFFESEGYKVEEVDATAAGESFEGMGDALWHPGRFLLWGGYGFRTDRAVYDHLEEQYGFPIIPLSLTDADFYHLDTCLAALSESTALIYPRAFDDAGLEALHSHFSKIIEAPEEEARRLFACNAHCPDGHHVIIQRGCRETNNRLRRAGFEPVEVDTDEYLKSGGSVFCMKVMFW
jgi:N-dimethylarginine dimethylaminohydrolase